MDFQSSAKFFIGTFIIIISWTATSVLCQSRPRVPSDFLGIWTGTAGSDNTPNYRATLAIVAGNSDKFVGMLELHTKKTSCLHMLEIQASSEETGSSINGAFLAATKSVTSVPSRKFDCWIGSFLFKMSGETKLIGDVEWRSAEEGEVVDNWLFALERQDDGSSSKASIAEQGLTPSVRLRCKLGHKENGDGR